MNSYCRLFYCTLKQSTLKIGTIVAMLDTWWFHKSTLKQSTINVVWDLSAMLGSCHEVCVKKLCADNLRSSEGLLRWHLLRYVLLHNKTFYNKNSDKSTPVSTRPYTGCNIGAVGVCTFVFYFVFDVCCEKGRGESLTWLHPLKNLKSISTQYPTSKPTTHQTQKIWLQIYNKNSHHRPNIRVLECCRFW